MAWSFGAWLTVQGFVEQESLGQVEVKCLCLSGLGLKLQMKR